MKSSDVATPNSRTPQLARWLIVITLIGVSLRLSQYASGRSLWHDEARLALSLRLPWGSVARQEHRDHAQPIGFLMVEKGLAGLLGDSEAVLRLFPLLCGLAAPLLMALLAARVLDRPGAAAAAALLAVCPEPVFYASVV